MLRRSSLNVFHNNVRLYLEYLLVRVASTDTVEIRSFVLGRKECSFFVNPLRLMCYGIIVV